MDLLTICQHALTWACFRACKRKVFQKEFISQGLSLAVGIATFVAQYKEHMFFEENPGVKESGLRCRWIDDSVV